MSRTIVKAFSISMAIFLVAISPVNAAQLFAGRWRSSGESPLSIAIIQYGETVTVFSKAGWAMLVLAPETGGMLASGKGKWSFNDTPSSIVDVTIGYRSDRLYLLIVPTDATGSANHKVILDRTELRPPNRRT